MRNQSTTIKIWDSVVYALNESIIRLGRKYRKSKKEWVASFDRYGYRRAADRLNLLGYHAEAERARKLGESPD